MFSCPVSVQLPPPTPTRLLMALWIYLALAVVVLGEVSGRTPAQCSPDILPCATSPSPRRGGGRRTTAPVWGEVAGQQPRRRPPRRRVARRKVHRHSTRVLSLKPAVILLPPYESLPSETTNRLDPFVINVANLTTTTLSLDLQALPLEDSPTTPRPPRRFLLPPVPEQRDNSIVETALQEPSSGYARPTTPDYRPAREYAAPNLTQQENPFVKLEKEYNDIQKMVQYDLVKESSNNTYEEPASRYTPERTSYEEYSPTPIYNSTTVQYTERWNDSFFEERSLKNNYNKPKNSFNFVNNSLLAPDVASLGMKIVTSKEGMEMLKEFAITNNATSYDEPVYNGGNVNLETAETGDFRLQAYDNQILTFDETNDPSKEALKAIKKTHKPFQICNGRQGYVPDSASGCQIFYICIGRGAGEPMMCPNGTLFNQDFLVCDWWYNVECNG